MKTINELEQEAQQAREDAINAVNMFLPDAEHIADKLILASVAMVTYQFALGMQEVIDCVPGDSNSCDGWIEWKGGNCPVKSSEAVEVKFRLQAMRSDVDMAGVYRWTHADKSGTVDGDPQCDIIAYRIVK